jgi:CDP-glucose 4,6-dehydratase
VPIGTIGFGIRAEASSILRPRPPQNKTTFIDRTCIVSPEANLENLESGRTPAENGEVTPDPAFWRGKRVLVTGHTGFKGPWLCLWLRLLGADVRGYALEPPTDPNLFEQARVADDVDSEIGDVRNAERLREAVVTYEPDIVLHLAAQSLVRRSYDDPIETISTNVLGTAHLLNAVRCVASVAAVVVVTSDKCYENREWPWAYREDEMLGGHDPYSASKAASELVARCFRLSFLAEAGVPVATARAGNVIGGGDWSDDRLVPDIVRALLRDERPEIRSPSATRPWQHVLEPLSGYLALAERLATDGQEFAEAWNFGPPDDDAKPVSWIVETVERLWGGPSGWDPQPGEHPYESTFLKLDASKAKARLGWRPRLRIADALEWVVEWSLGYRDGADLRALTEAQIRRYADLA